MADNEDSVYRYFKKRNPEIAEDKLNVNMCLRCRTTPISDGSVLCKTCREEIGKDSALHREETATLETDFVNHPPHYKQGGIETIDFLQAKLGDQGFEAFCVGNVIKYITRYEHKGQPLQDLQKAQFYLTKAIEIYEKYRMDT